MGDARSKDLKRRQNGEQTNMSAAPSSSQSQDLRGSEEGHLGDVERLSYKIRGRYRTSVMQKKPFNWAGLRDLKSPWSIVGRVEGKPNNASRDEQIL